MPKFLICVVGPTAIGKTAMAIQLAQHFHCEIVSCDSRQFFKEMKIGTAVPDEDELAAATHHFIQNKSIFEPYTVGDFEKEALEKLDLLFQKSGFAILAGGSGLYVDAVLKGFDKFPDTEESVRESVKSNYEKYGIDYLQNELQTRDPKHYASIDTANPQRMMRAVEVSIATGKPYSSFLNQKENKRPFIPILIGLEAERPVLYSRINQRVDLMIQAGLLEEARNLYPNKNLNALQTVGYRELFAYFDNEITFDFAVDEIKKNTRRFAKRQLTWFKRNDAIKWFDFKANPDLIATYIEKQNQY